MQRQTKTRQKNKAALSPLFLYCFMVMMSFQRFVFADGSQTGTIVTPDGKKQISQINIQLPISNCESCGQVQHEVSATNGCYEWEVSHPSMVKMINYPTTGECVHTVSLTAISRKESKTLVQITARDRDSGSTLRCVAKVGKVHHLSIHQHFKQFHEGTYNFVEVIGYDDDDNVFSTLDGFRFDWSIMTGLEVLKKVQMKEARAKIQRSSDFEFDQTDIVFFKGISPGRATIQVTLQEPGYESVRPTSVAITVVHQFVIMPQHEIFMLPASEFQYSLAHQRMDLEGLHYEPIHIPNEQYQWSTESKHEFGTIKDDGIFRSKLQQGQTDIIVIDQRQRNNTAEATVNVVFPSQLKVQIWDVTNKLELVNTLPNDGSQISFMEHMQLSKLRAQAHQSEDNQILIEEHTYLFRAQLFDKDNNEITLTPNVEFASNIMKLSSTLDFIKANKIGSEVFVKVKNMETPDAKKIQSFFTLKDIKSYKAAEKFHFDSKRLSNEKDLMITKPVKIQHPLDTIRLPFVQKSAYQRQGEIWTTSATGGSGIYTWSVVDQSIVSLTGSTITSRGRGETILTASDYRNPSNKASVRVVVTPVGSIGWLEDQIELEQTKETSLNIIAYDQFGNKFTNCTILQGQYGLESDGVLKSVQKSQENNYLATKEYAARNYKLLELRQRFDEDPTAATSGDLTSQSKYTKDMILHNNFGICSQQTIFGLSPGVQKVTAKVDLVEPASQTVQQVQADPVEVAVYTLLKTARPNYEYFLSDLQSRSKVGQEIQSLKTFYGQETDFAMQFGTSFKWSLTGGTNFWSGHKSDVRVKHIGSSDQEQLLSVSQFDKHQFQEENDITTTFSYGVSCKSPSYATYLSYTYQYELTLIQFSPQTRHLLRPATLETKINVNCQPPFKQRLFWSQQKAGIVEERQLANLPRSKLIQDERVNYVLVNSTHYVRALALNEKLDHVSLNHSSVKNHIYSSDEQYVRLFELQNSYKEQLNANTYDKRGVQILDKVGTAYIRSEFEGYYNYLLDNTDPNSQVQKKTSGGWFGSSVTVTEINQNAVQSLQLSEYAKAQLRLEIVRNVDIEPKYKSLYLGRDSGEQNAFKFRIVHGSGFFTASVSDTSVAEIVTQDRDVWVYPKKVGQIILKVEDVEIPDAKPSTAEILVSDVYRVQLESIGSLIEQGSSTELYVSAYDSQNQEFDDDQYRLMKFDIETETSGVQRRQGLKTNQVQDDNRKFTAYGADPGLYQLIAYTDSHWNKDTQYHTQRSRVVSEMHQMEVFPRLEIRPSSLLITPNMRYTLKVIGGPSRSSYDQHDRSHVDVKFDIEDKNVATVDMFKEVTGHEIGDTVLNYEIVQMRTPSATSHQREQKISVLKKQLKIRVRLVTDIDIPYNHKREIYAGSIIKVIGILKYGEEIFNQGIAPISYSWNCTEYNVVSLALPSKQDLAQTHGIATDLTNIKKYVRDNSMNRDVEFLSSFNSSSVYATANRDGDALLQTRIAIEYPSQYKYERNWFSKEVVIHVAKQLSIDVPRLMPREDSLTSMYLLPPKALNKIETNKNTKLRLGYSLQSVYDYSTQRFEYQDSQTPIIELVRDTSIRTLDKYGKVTVLVEENESLGNQLAMLNVVITDIYSIASMSAYEALSLPLGSSIKLPINFQNDNAHLFADRIEGVNLMIELSHPRVVTAQLDNYNQTLTLISQGSGECNVILYLEDHPEIFDVIRVRVSTIVEPLSPVDLHVGGEVRFNIKNSHVTDPDSNNVRWASSNPEVLQINSSSGQAKALGAGKVEVLLSNFINAASIVNVRKVTHAEIDQDRSNVVINTSDQGTLDDQKVRIKLYLEDQVEELLPSVQYNGITLIKQKAGIVCETDQPDYIQAKGEVNDLDGFFCSLRYNGGADYKNMPRRSKIRVKVFGGDNIQNALYETNVLQFDVSLASPIIIESKHRKGIEFNPKKREQKLRVFSSNDFKVEVKSLSADENDSQLIKYKVSRENEESNEYEVMIQISTQVTEPFDANIIFWNEFAQDKTILPVKFTPEVEDKASYLAFPSYGGSDEQEEAQFDSSSYQRKDTTTEGGSAWLSYLIFTIFIFFLLQYLLIQCCQTDLFIVCQALYDTCRGRDRYYDGRNQRYYRRGEQDYYADHRDRRQPYPYQSTYRQPGQRSSYYGSGRVDDSIREPMAYRKQNLSRDSSYMRGDRDEGLRRRAPVNLDRIDYSAQSDRRFRNPNESTIYRDGDRSHYN